MKRRDFLTYSSTAATLAAFNPDYVFAKAAQINQGLKPTYLDDIYQGYAPLKGLAGQDLSAFTPRITGRLPVALSGALYRNGPALFERGAGASKERYEHPFDGDGFVQAWRIHDGKASFKGKFVRTPKFVEEQAAGEFKLHAFGSKVKNARKTQKPDETNTANTNVIMHGGKLLALWEAGSAYELDAQTLETRGPVTWRDDLKHMPFCAHPKLSHDGTLWNIGYIGSGLVLYEIEKNGALKRCELVPVPQSVLGGVPLLHDFAITAGHIVLLIPPMKIDREALKAGTPYGQAAVWDAKGSLKAVTINKTNLKDIKVYELPAAMVFHIGNAYEAADGTIAIDFAQFESSNVMSSWMPRVMRNERVREDEVPLSAPVQVRLNRTNGTASITLRNEQIEFPRVDPRFVGLANRYTFAITSESGRRGSSAAPRVWGFDAVARFDWQTGRREQHSYDENWVVDEHVLVPKPYSVREGEGWLVGGYFDRSTQKSGLVVLDAERISNGPIAQIELPFWTPMVFHGNFEALKQS